MSGNYRDVIQEFFDGWSEQQRDEIKENAIMSVASSIRNADRLYDREDFEDLFEGNETVVTKQVESDYKQLEGVSPDTERRLRKAEEQYAEDRAMEGIDRSDVEFDFGVSDRTVEIKVPETNYLEVLENFQDYSGEVTITLNKSVPVDIGDEEEMMQAAESGGEWELEGISPEIQFSGGTIEKEYNTDALIIEAEKYTEELDEILDKLDL